MSHRMTRFPPEGRPDHALSDGYPLVVNMKKHPYACVECASPCGKETFYFGDPDCESRHPGIPPAGHRG